MNNREARRSGRTQRMIEEAVRLATDGKRVLVIAATGEHRKELIKRLAEMTGGVVDIPGGTISTLAGGVISVHVYSEPAVDIGGGRMVGAGPSAFLVDHYAKDCWHRSLFADAEKRRK